MLLLINNNDAHIILAFQRLARMCEINKCGVDSVCVIRKHEDRFTTDCVKGIRTELFLISIL